MEKTITTGVDWSAYNKFDDIDERYLPRMGEGETMATQLVTAVSKLVYKWYNDGDVYDNTGKLHAWGNDLSSYANWLYEYVGWFDDDQRHVKKIMEKVFFVDEDGYEELLYALTEATHDEHFLQVLNEIPKKGSVYKCKGIFEINWDAEEEDDYDEEEWA